ncbi:MAG: crossover junction endodeoxyribonuclease RuvC [Clostridiales bacterium]|nr:crossover junction endodeoxyribonuclease RuvC [Clostridiales bacterium]
MRILGIDPGYATIGYGIIDKLPQGLKAVDYGVIETPKTESIPVRLAILSNAMTGIIKKYKPDAISVEELFFNTNITTGIKVAQARGVILLCAINECGHLYEYTPLQIKQALTGNGRADKKQMQYMVKAFLKLKEEPKPDDAADALAAAICHAHTATYNQRVLN